MYVHSGNGELGPVSVPNFQSRQAYALGSTLIITGIISFILHIVELCVKEKPSLPLSYIGYGFWCGITIVSLLVLSIVSFCFAGVQIILGSISAQFSSEYMTQCMYRGSTLSDYCRSIKTFYAMTMSQAMLGVIAFAASVWGSILACARGGCCCCSSLPAPVPDIYIVTGSFGEVSGYTKRRDFVITLLVLSIFSLCFSCVQTGLAGDSVELRNYICKSDRLRHYMDPDYCKATNPGFVIEITLTALGVVAFAASLWASMLACARGGCCCCCPNSGVSAPETQMSMLQPISQQTETLSETVYLAPNATTITSSSIDRPSGYTDQRQMLPQTELNYDCEEVEAEANKLPTLRL